MAQIILLTDIWTQNGEIGYGRAVGPYILASKARKAGYDCVVVEHFTKTPRLFELLNELIGPETLFIGVSSTFLSVETQNTVRKKVLEVSYGEGHLWCDTRADLEEWVEKIRQVIQRKGAKAPVVLGGTKALQGVMEDKLKGLFDFYVIGKTESFFVELIGRLNSGESLPFKEHNGSNYLTEQSFNCTTDTLETVQWEPCDLVEPSEGIPIEIAKGCLYNCKFCHFEKQGSIRRTVESLKAELIRNYEKFGTTVYTFVDDCFNDTRPKVEEVCNALLSLPFKIEWVSHARVDVACKFPHTLELMVESGARGLLWGIETLNHQVGRSVGKGTDPEAVKAMLLDFKSRFRDKTLMMGSFIVGLPGETEESIRTTVDWLCKEKPFDFVFMPVLGLRLYSERLDKVVVDFADFSRNPAKYGFEQITFSPNYWKHAQMDSRRAYELKSEFQAQLYNSRVSGSWIWNTFQYPHLRHLGLSHEEIANYARNDRWDSETHKKILDMERKTADRYFDSLFAFAKQRSDAATTLSQCVGSQV